MGSMSGQMGERKSFTDRKIPGFSSNFAKRVTGINAKGFSAKTQGNYSIKSPRQAKGSRGDGMNGGN